MVDTAKEASLDIEIQVLGVKPLTPNTSQISFVIKGWYEAAADFAACTDSVIRNLLEKASTKDASKLPLEKIQKIKTIWRHVNTSYLNPIASN